MPSTVGTRKEPERPSPYNHKVKLILNIIYYCKINTIYIVPQVPSDITTLPTYDQSGQLSQLIVQWSHEVGCNGIIIIDHENASDDCSLCLFLRGVLMIEVLTTQWS